MSERTSSPFHRESRIGSLLTAGGGAEMSAVVLLCGNVFDGLSDALTGPAEILVESNGFRGSRGRWGGRPARG